jgi:hypothetical protein
LFWTSSWCFKNPHPPETKLPIRQRNIQTRNAPLNISHIILFFFPSRNLGFIVQLDAECLLLKRKKLAARWVELL